MRVSAHTEAGFLVLSTWKSGACVGTVRLLPDEAADLVAGVAGALARLADPVGQQAPHGDLATQVALATQVGVTVRIGDLESRLAELEERTVR